MLHTQAEAEAAAAAEANAADAAERERTEAEAARAAEFARKPATLEEAVSQMVALRWVAGEVGKRGCCQRCSWWPARCFVLTWIGCGW